MNAIIDPADVAPGMPRDPQASQTEAEGASVYTLRRTGRKPVRLEGWQLVEAIGPTGAAQVQHNLNIYRTISGGVVIQLIIRRHLPEHQDLFRVKMFEDLAASAAWLEQYRAGDDVPIPASFGAADAALPWAVLQSVQLRQCIDRIEADYQTLLSEVFSALDLADPAGV